MLTLVDHVSRVSPAIEVGGSLTGRHVVAVLDRLRATYGAPGCLRMDNGPEFVSKALDAWADSRSVQLIFSRPGKPTDTAVIEALNRRFRDECLDQH